MTSSSSGSALSDVTVSVELLEEPGDTSWRQRALEAPTVTCVLTQDPQPGCSTAQPQFDSAPVDGNTARMQFEAAPGALVMSISCGVRERAMVLSPFSAPSNSF